MRPTFENGLVFCIRNERRLLKLANRNVLRVTENSLECLILKLLQFLLISIRKCYQKCAHKIERKEMANAPYMC